MQTKELGATTTQYHSRTGDVLNVLAAPGSGATRYRPGTMGLVCGGLQPPSA